MPLFVTSLLACTGCAQVSRSDEGERAQRVFDRTKTVTATYSAYSWSWVRDSDGQPSSGWAAEFHRGTLHRVETPDARIVADCANQTGTWLQVSTGERLSGPRIAAAACGIQSNAEIVELRWLEERAGRFGKIDMIRILDAQDERFYAVNADGVLVAGEIFPRAASASYCVQSRAVAVEASLPEEDIFSEASLARSFVPERFQSAPSEANDTLWASSRRCLA